MIFDFPQVHRFTNIDTAPIIPSPAGLWGACPVFVFESRYDPVNTV
jgi:hypothetical protein